MIKSIEWCGDHVRIIDQTCLPSQLVYREIRSTEEMAEAIRSLRIRGAPLIGVSAAYGVALADRNGESVEKAIHLLSSTRPTAVNLFKSLERMGRVWSEGKGSQPSRLLEEAFAIQREDEDLCQKIGEFGETLLKNRATVLTHCNTGFLATAGWGTALGVIYAARSKGKEVKVYVSETRPLLQGSRLTAWELKESGISVILLSDGSAGALLKKGEVDLVIVGADRIARNGDTANKVGTYPLSLLAREHRVPFYVAAPSTTFDPTLKSGDEIPIEERSGEEIGEILGKRVAPPGVEAYNPAFDITPARNITAIITDQGILHPPYEKPISNLQMTNSK